MDARSVPKNYHLHGPPPQPSLHSSAHRPHIPNGSSDGDASKKRRTSTTTSRGVANLTPDQLAKKRANDREAQRAIRERTKTQIESLEKRIRDLTNQQPHQELQSILKQKQLVEAENQNIKKRLNAALLLLQPLVGANGGTGHDRPRDTSVTPSISTLKATASTSHAHPMNHVLSQYSDTASIRSTTSVSPTFGTASPAHNHHSPVTSSPPYASHGSMFPPGSANLEQQRHNLTNHLNINTSGERLNLGFLLDRHVNSPHISHRIPAYPHVNTSLSPTDLPAAVQTPKPSSSFDPPLVAYNVPIRNIPPTCPVDVILLDFLAERRARAAEGASPTNLVGPPYPSVSSLLNPERSLYAHPLSKVFTDILSKFPDLSELPEQVAVLYVMFLIMRWQISPTRENYDRLPEWVTPRASQLFTPHPAWVDHLPWPRMRDRMCELYPEISLDSWFIPYTSTLSLNWKYEPCDTLLSISSEGGGQELSINPVFERHLRDLSNWTLGPAFEKAFPMVADTCVIKQDEGKRARGR
ncbi:MAG: hypothetical protein LQ349_006448 [Xanthoria aureola]|nr:MAG: hypothetical protein LQ349_006448 [Xanthoria aureola]